MARGQRDRERGVPWRSPVLFLVTAILYSLYTSSAGTMGTAVDGAMGLDPMPQEPTPTVAARGRQSLDGTLKAVKGM